VSTSTSGANLGVPALTAHRCLYADGPVDGRTVLVAGGAGAVGHFAIELARAAGATVIATVSSPEKAALATAAGAHHVVNYRSGDPAGRIRAAAPDGVDRIVEVALADNLALDVAVAAPHASIVTYAADAKQPTLTVRDLMTRNLVLRFMMLYTGAAGRAGAGGRRRLRRARRRLAHPAAGAPVHPRRRGPRARRGPGRRGRKGAHRRVDRSWPSRGAKGTVNASDRHPGVCDMTATTVPATAGPRGSRLLGLARELAHDPTGTYEAVMLANPVVGRIVIGPPGRRVTLHLVSHPDGVQEVLVGSGREHTKDTPFYREIAAWIGNGLLTSEGATWKQQRRTARAAVHTAPHRHVRHGDGRGGVDRRRTLRRRGTRR
jgi:NAD(P)-dependent dehydrogenase (short-subunit alcohol dehydrogenase family)